MNFLLKKQLIKFSCTYWSLSFCKILKKFLELTQSYKDVPFQGPQWPIFHEQFFFGTSHYYYFRLPTGPFHCAKFKKNSYNGSRVTRMRHFWAQNGPFAPKKIFLKKLLISFSYTYQLLSLCEILKKSFQRIQSYEDAQFLDPNGSFPQMRIFFQKTC